jgi:hypothetical protein
LERGYGQGNQLEKAIHPYRSPVDGRTMTDSEVRRVLKESRRSAERKAVWEGSKGVGPIIASDRQAAEPPLGDQVRPGSGARFGDR